MSSPTLNETTTQKRPVHVMHVIDKLSVGGSQVHGIGKAIEWWIPRFDPAHFTFSVVSLREVEPFGEVFKAQGTPIDFLCKGKLDVTTVTALIKLIRERDVGVLHLHGYGACNFGRLVSLLTGVPNIVHEHSVFDDQPFHQTIADKMLSPLTGTPIAISRRVGDYMVERRSIKRDRLHTFFYGLPMSEFVTPPQHQIDALREELFIAKGVPVVGSVGRLDTQKGLIYLMKAIKEIVRDIPDAVFVLVGDGPLRTELEQFAEHNQLTSNVRFTGFRADVPTVMAMSDVFAIPSMWEGGPITLFEAMCLGKPVVGTPVGVIDEVLVDGETGYIVPCGNAEALADRIGSLLGQPEAAREMGDAARVAVQEYDIQHSIEKLTRIYHSLSD